MHAGKIFWGRSDDQTRRTPGSVGVFDRADRSSRGVRATDLAGWGQPGDIKLRPQLHHRRRELFKPRASHRPTLTSFDSTQIRARAQLPMPETAPQLEKLRLRGGDHEADAEDNPLIHFSHVCFSLTCSLPTSCTGYPNCARAREGVAVSAGEQMEH